MIEEKIRRLTPDQQHEVEDFIDFLTSRDTDTIRHSNDNGRPENFPDFRDEEMKQRPLIFAEERPVAGRIDQDILPDYPEYGGSEPVAKQREPGRRIILPRRNEKEPGKLLDWID